ncbi:MAG: methionine synthase [Alphaproteobacteria bacterium]
MSDFLNCLQDQVLLCDGSMGVLIQMMPLHLEKDFWNKENCSEVLVLSRPDIIRDIHTRYYESGADMVETNTFGASEITLGEFGLADRCFEINKTAVEIAKEAASSFSDGRKRFVLGSIGPGTKLPSLDHIAYDALEKSYITQCEGLEAGGADAYLIETCQDMLQFKAAINAAKIAGAKRNIPILLQVTMETTGTMLTGADIAAAATVASSLDVNSFGLNCATGPLEMSPHIKWLSENWSALISVQPNAGLPERIDGKTLYPLTPAELARWHEKFISEYGVNIVGGCCGTMPEHILSVDNMLRRIGNGKRPAPVKRKIYPIKALASLYSSISQIQENAFFAIGERCNANGSKKFRDTINAEDWESIVSLAREQEKEGSHALDICVAYVGRNEKRDITEAVKALRGAVNIPLVIDSTDTSTIETALKLYGGKGIVNSINFEDGEGIAEERVKLAKKYGAGVVALTIDEKGMARCKEDKLAIAKRLYEFACIKHHLPPEDLFIDPLTFTICTGNVDDRGLAIETLEAIKLIHNELPRCQIVLGLSNVSFGLKPAARHVLNSVFLHHAMAAGMTSAILHVSKIKPLHLILEQEKNAAEDLIFNKDENALERFMALFEGRSEEASEKDQVQLTIEEALEKHIVDGERKGLEAALDEALKKYKPLDIINNILLSGMKTVGDLFGSGKMQLPFVLRSAETMKASVSYLEPFMEKTSKEAKAKMVLATVKGDVHDIGKNLVDIILTNNGYKVVNLGIKQPIADIMKAAKEEKADAVGMSGLLVKSTLVMKENLMEMTKEGFDIPVILGGAALTRAYVEDECIEAYDCGKVAYAKDAFDSLSMMEKIANNSFDDLLAERKAQKQEQEKKKQEVLAKVKAAKSERPETEDLKLKRSEITHNYKTPEPPFWGTRVVESVPLKNLIPYINQKSLFRLQWGYKYKSEAEEKELKSTLNKIIAKCDSEKILTPCAVYGYFKCASENEDIVIFDETGAKEITRFSFPRQKKDGGICIADFFKNINEKERDVIAFHAVTAGSTASIKERELFNNGDYENYLYLHGVSVEIAETMAEHIHKKVREELGFGAEDAEDMRSIFKQGYHGSRYSFGYPACPDLSQQSKILDLLKAERIGISLSDESQLYPEQSTTAIIVHHVKAKYFAV